MLLVGVGVAAGLAGGLAISQLITRFLYGLSSRDPATCAGVAVVSTAVAFRAHYLRVRRALRVALR